MEEGCGRALAAVAGDGAVLEVRQAVLDLIWAHLDVMQCLPAMRLSTPVLASHFRLLLR
jgi:hypothetical protein